MKKKSDTNSILPKTTQCVGAILAFIVSQNFRLTFSMTPMLLLAEALFYLAIPVVALVAYRKHWLRSTNLTGRDRSTFVVTIAIGMGVLTILVQIGLRQFGYGDANEIVAITSVLNAALTLAILSGVFEFERAVFWLCSCLVLFICFTTQSTAVFVTAFCYLTIAIWWMLESYWQRLQTNALDAESESMSIRLAVWGGSIIFAILIGGLAMFVGPIRETISLPGFMLTSGGENGYSNMYSRAGVGDGDMLTNGENATSVGAVETDQFIEDDKPSLYDIMSDSYDGPKMKRTEQSKAVTPDAIAKHIHDLKQAEQSGKTFRTLREPAEQKTLDVEDRISNALFYVEGPVPTRFAVDYFHQFDGWDWSKLSMSKLQSHKPKIELEFHQEKPWYTITIPDFGLLTGERHHIVKVMRLKTKNLPVPPFLKAWHIHQVDREKFFRLNSSGAIDLNGGILPSQSVINTISQIPNFNQPLGVQKPVSRDELKILPTIKGWFGIGSITDESSSLFVRRSKQDGSAPLLYVPENITKARLQALVKKWTNGTSKGWSQIQAIVSNMRNEFILDPALVASESSSDPIASFLDNGGGPAYLFATTAAMALRSAGYETRLAHGFVVRKKDFVRTSNQSIVDNENFHAWPEVRMGESLWIPVEPTPGYPMPARYKSTWEHVVSAVSFLFNWVILNPILFLSILISLGFVVCYRKALLSVCFWCFWYALFFLRSKARLRMTRQLLDLRFWAAGIPRPPSLPIQSWFGQLNSNHQYDFFMHWNRAQFSDSFDSNSDRHAIERACSAIVAELSLRRINNFVKRNESANSH